MTNKYSRRFEELSEEYKAVEKTKGLSGSEGELVVDLAVLSKWVVKVEHLLSELCGESSQHFQHFRNSLGPSLGVNAWVRLSVLKAVFEAAKEDYENGYLSSMRSLIQAEVFSTELEQASELLAKGYKAPAAVIAGTVLETALRELCDRNSIFVGKLEKMNADLSKAGAYNLLRQKQITAIAEIRNKAAHGKPSEFTDDDVNSMIGDVERFLLEYL